MFSLMFFARCLLAILFLNASNAFPIAIRQATNSTQLSGPTTVMTVSNSMTPAGELTQTCIITLTPITDTSGKPAVQEVKNCTVAMNANANSTSATSSSSTPSDSSSTTSLSSSSSTSSVSDTAASSTPSSTPSVASVSSTSITTNGAISVNGGVSTMSALTPGTQSTSVGAVSASTTSSSGVSTGLSSSTPSTALASPTGSSTPTAAAANSDPSASGLASQQLAEQTYVVPGKNLQVLPIGLGVFAGISALALIVVGLVTYERTKYRKAFRQRKLAEQGAAMGYSR